MKTEDRKLAVLSFTDRGQRLAERLADAMHGTASRSSHTLSVSEWTKQQFQTADAILFVGACGIAVRAIAPFLVSKVSDPAVVVVDERAHFAIPILSGHLGGANDLAREVSRVCGAQPVITTATDINGVFAVDEWARHQHCRIQNPGCIRYVSSALLNQDTVPVVSCLPVMGEVPEGIRYVPDLSDGMNEMMEHADSNAPEEKGSLTEKKDRQKKQTLWEVMEGYPAGILVDFKTTGETLKFTGQLTKKHIIWLVPQILVLGIGCRKGTSAKQLEKGLHRFLVKNGICRAAITAAASIDIKKKEPGLQQFCRKNEWALETYPAAVLQKAHGHFTPSDFVRSVTGVDNVCERSAAVCSGGPLLVKKQIEEGVTFALAQVPEIMDWSYRNG